MKIAVDLDGVIANIEGEIVHRLEKIGIKTNPKWWPSFYIEDHISGIPEGWATELFNDELFYLNAIAYEDAFYSLNEWFYAGNDVFIITSRGVHLEEITLRWLDEWSIAYNKTIVGAEKLKKFEIAKELGADIMIEDYPHEAEVLMENGIETYLINRPYNKLYEYKGKKPSIVSDLYTVTARLVRRPDFKTRRNRESSFYWRPELDQ